MWCVALWKDHVENMGGPCWFARWKCVGAMRVCNQVGASPARAALSLSKVLVLLTALTLASGSGICKLIGVLKADCMYMM